MPGDKGQPDGAVRELARAVSGLADGALLVALALSLLAPAVSTWAESPVGGSSGGTNTVYLSFVAANVRLPGHIGYGANVSAADNARYLAEIGFDWAKGFVSLDYHSSQHDWVQADNQIREYLRYGVSKALLRLTDGAPPRSESELALFQEASRSLAVHVAATWRPQGLRQVAYEVWNEPNLDYEWRGGAPDPAAYVAVLRAAYLGIKAGDPAATVVSGGVATTGASPQAWLGTAGYMDDLEFIRGMYRAGGAAYFDALGSHPYGGGTEPEVVRGAPYFRRAEEQRQVMLEFGDAETPVWATEFGWIGRCEQCDLGEHERVEVSYAQQAGYLVRAFRYAEANWPWMGPMFVFNLDFGTVGWYEYCDPIRWYSVLYRENPKSDPGSVIFGREALDALRAMPKN